MATPLDEFLIEYGWGENTKPCPECKGTGSVTLFVSVSPCKPCEGTGRIADDTPRTATEMQYAMGVDPAKKSGVLMGGPGKVLLGGVPIQNIPRLGRSRIGPDNHLLTTHLDSMGAWSRFGLGGLPLPLAMPPYPKGWIRDPNHPAFLIRDSFPHQSPIGYYIAPDGSAQRFIAEPGYVYTDYSEYDPSDSVPIDWEPCQMPPLIAYCIRRLP